MPSSRLSAVTLFFTFMNRALADTPEYCNKNDILRLRSTIQKIIDTVGLPSFVSVLADIWIQITVALRLLEAELYPSDKIIEHFMDIKPNNTLQPDQYQSLGFLRCRLDAPTLCHEVLESIRCLQKLQLTIDCSRSA